MWNGDINNIDQVVLYVNNELEKGRTQKDIENNDFKVNERVIAKKLKRKGYIKNNNRWEYNICIRSDSGQTTDSIGEDRLSKDSIVKDNIDNNSSNCECDNSNTLIIKDENIKNNLINLSNNYDKILKIIELYDKRYEEQYDNKYEGQYDNIEIELPLETIKDFRTSIRINNVIWEQFDKFASGHKQFTKRDLLSMALKEYIKNHSKE